MIKKLITIILLMTAPMIFSQSMLKSFEINKLNVSSGDSSPTPLSNSVSEILFVQDTIWLGTSRGLSRSVDNGLTWKNYFNHPDFGQEAIVSLGYSEGRIWAATFHAEDKGPDIGVVRVGSGYRYTEDGGENWTIIPQPIDEPGDSLITYGNNELYMLPIVVEEQNITYDIAFTKGTVWVSSWSSGLRKSTDLGKTWERVLLPPDTLNTIQPEDDLDFRTNPRDNNNHLLFSIHAVSDNEIWCGSAGGINRSTDGGISWSKFNHQNQENSISGNWVIGIEENLADGSIWAVTRKADAEDEIYGLSSTSDGGANWKTFLPGTSGNNVAMRYHLNNGKIVDGDVIFLTDEGAYRSENYGYSWIVAPEIRDARNNTPVFSNNFSNASSRNLNDFEAEVWLGTSGGGLSRILEENQMWVGEWRVLFSSGKLESTDDTYAFPNPFSPNKIQTKITYTTAGQNADVTIRIMDFGMNLVRTLIQNAPRYAQDANHVEEWNGRDDNGNLVPNGVYFYRIDISSKDPLYGKIMVIR